MRRQIPGVDRVAVILSAGVTVGAALRGVGTTRENRQSGQQTNIPKCNAHKETSASADVLQPEFGEHFEPPSLSSKRGN